MEQATSRTIPVYLFVYAPSMSLVCLFVCLRTIPVCLFVWLFTHHPCLFVQLFTYHPCLFVCLFVCLRTISDALLLFDGLLAAGDLGLDRFGGLSDARRLRRLQMIHLVHIGHRAHQGGRLWTEVRSGHLVHRAHQGRRLWTEVRSGHWSQTQGDSRGVVFGVDGDLPLAAVGRVTSTTRRSWYKS